MEIKSTTAQAANSTAVSPQQAANSPNSPRQAASNALPEVALASSADDLARYEQSVRDNSSKPLTPEQVTELAKLLQRLEQQVQQVQQVQQFAPS